MSWEPLNDNSEMPFGKYKGTKMANVPADYLMYLYENGDLNGRSGRKVYRYIHNNLDAIKQELKNG